MRPRAPRLAACVVPLLLAGCTLAVSLSGLTSNGSSTDDAGDAGDLPDSGDIHDGAVVTDGGEGGALIDAAADADASFTDDSGTPTLPDGGMLTNLLPQGDFESVNASCGLAFQFGNANGTRVTASHGGTYACQACGLNRTEFSIDPYPSGLFPVSAGEVYTAQAWVRGTGSPPVVIRIRIYDGGSGVQEFSISPQVIADGTWRKISVTQTVHANGTINVGVPTYGQTAASGACVTVDDWALYRVQ